MRVRVMNHSEEIGNKVTGEHYDNLHNLWEQSTQEKGLQLKRKWSGNEDKSMKCTNTGQIIDEMILWLGSLFQN